MDALPASFEPLQAYHQFIIYILLPSKTRQGKFDKLPVDFRTKTYPANAHDPTIWLDANTALSTAKLFGNAYGVGFVFTEQDPFWFLDIDDCLESCGTKWSEIALSLCKIFYGAAVEVSSSGRGLHIIGSGKAPAHSCRNNTYKLEYYTSRRFAALTGKHVSGNAGLDCTPALEWLVQYYFPPSSAHAHVEWSETPVPEWSGPEDDDALIGRALESHSGKSAFGQGASFQDLWEANEKKLTLTYPPNDVDIYNRSSADAALAQHLAFWTGNNCERMRKLMFRSTLRRDKWEREDYLPRTILNACSRQKDFLGSRKSSTCELTTSSSAQSISTLEWSDVSIHDIFTNPPEPLLFLIEHWLPAGLLTLLSAHGGSGKSMLALQAAVCISMGLPFMGKQVIQNRTLFYSGEDSKHIIRHRLTRICHHMAIDPQEVAINLRIIDATALPCLYTEAMSKQKGETTTEYQRLSDYLNDFNANVLIVDNASDTFDANENNRTHVRGFIRALVQLGKKQKTAILLLAHIDKHTAKGDNNKSEGYSGSTAWHNSARSRLFLSSDHDGKLTLNHQKSNHGKLSDSIYLQWSSDGVLVYLRDDHTDTHDQTILIIVLSLIDTNYKRGDFISPKRNARPTAFKALKDDPEFPLSIRDNKQMIALLKRAEDTGWLKREEYQDRYRNKLLRYKVIELKYKTISVTTE